MVVTQLKETSRNRIEVYFEGEFTFWLTKKEIKKLDIKEGKNIPVETVNNIIESIIVRKAKSKALSLLKYSDRTEMEMRQRLKKEKYLDDVIQKVIDYLKGYDYINDENYAYKYVSYKKHTKSIALMKSALKQKGIDPSITQTVLGEVKVDEEATIEKIIEKKLRLETNDHKEMLQKLYYYLVRKGFTPTTVMRVIKQYEQDIIQDIQ